MKSMLVVALTLSVCPIFAQEGSVLPKPVHGVHDFPDSIRVEFQDPSAMIIFQFKTPTNADEKMDQIMKSLPILISNLERSLPDISRPRQIDVSESKDQQNVMVRGITSLPTTFTVKDKDITEMLPPGWEIRIHSDHASVFVYAPTFDQLKFVSTYDAQQIIQKVKTFDEAGTHGRKRLVARFIVNKDKVLFSELNWQMPEDFIVGTGSTGLGLLGDKFYPELNAVITVRWNDHFNRPKHRYSLIYNNLFFMEKKSDGGYSVKPNSFLSLSWSGNLDGTGTYFGLGAGYLVLRNGDYFKGNTAKFFISKSYGGYSVAPEFYLTNDFKNFQMGIRLNYTF